MKINELKNAPEWLKQARVENENVKIINGQVVWFSGTWRGGVWHDGTWHGGEWHGGEWHDGWWRGGVWRGGEWHGGKWRGGEWHGGVWCGGEWRGGEWRGGFSSIRSPYRIITDGRRLLIGCKTKTIPQWDEWFAGGEEFDTPRGTEKFRMIEAHYRAMKAYMKHMTD